MVPDLREDKEFTDVTLACGDGLQVEADKVVLIALSLGNSISFQDSYFPDYISRSKNTFQKFVTKFHLFVGRCHFPKFNFQILDNNSGLLR